MFDKFVKNVEYSIWTDGYNWSFWKTGGGWGEVLRRYKPYTPKEKKEGGDEAAGKGKAPLKVNVGFKLNTKHVLGEMLNAVVL